MEKDRFEFDEKEVLEEENEDRDYVGEIVRLIRSELSEEELLEKLEDYHENDIAGAFEQLEARERKKLYKLLGPEKISEIFTFIDDVSDYLEEMDLKEVAHVIENMDSDDAVEVLEEMDDSTQEQLKILMDQDASDDIWLIKSYDEDEIGSKMTTNFILINKNMSVRKAMKSLIQQAEKNDNISTLYVSDDDDKYYGALELKDLITARDYMDLQDFMITSFPYVKAHEKISECIERLKEYEEDSIPVLDDDSHVIGIITSQDILEVVDEEMGDDYAKLAGLTSEEDLKETLGQSMKKRMPWLIILLFLGMGVSAVVGMFEPVVAEIAMIVSFQSLILDMAGNVGTQSLAVTIRVLVDENLTAKQKMGLVWKEMRIGFVNGLLLGILSFFFVGFYISLSKHASFSYGFSIAMCVAAALLVAMVISSLVGTVVPMFFHKIKVDPAVASGPLITTVNDLVAVITYYGLTWILLINMLHITG
ncbi:MAG: magnesium transporter [Clostridiales bacterium]|nr:magnesium transporter [Clostridiales bacterium]MBS5878494.1 magnesium transporter [Clostridiales bacterium]MDU0940129.1 magnesium transporter [Clostridiales bacterium]MDU1042794.1 magnesium transporter [Clostridiales bacterium]MDU3490246.1 magnesium transporter [Clostridiales bacterium]